jgi:hypothetical protein
MSRREKYGGGNGLLELDGSLKGGVDMRKVGRRSGIFERSGKLEIVLINSSLNISVQNKLLFDMLAGRKEGNAR